MVRKLSNDHMTDEEKALPSFTRRRLMTLSNWPEWQAADDKQLNQHLGWKSRVPQKIPPHRPKYFVYIGHGSLNPVVSVSPEHVSTVCDEPHPGQA